MLKVNNYNQTKLEVEAVKKFTKAVKELSCYDASLANKTIEDLIYLIKENLTGKQLSAMNMHIYQSAYGLLDDIGNGHVFVRKGDGNTTKLQPIVIHPDGNIGRELGLL